MNTAEAVINFDAIRHNYNVLKHKCYPSQLAAVIKGDAYGHNAVQIAKALPNADLFAVSRFEEGIELREAGITQPILLLEGCFCSADLEIAASQGFHTAIHCPEQLEDFLAAALPCPIRVWLKVDTGMHRLGIQPNEIPDYVTQLTDSGKVKKDVGFMSHFSCADNLNSPTTAQQIKVFNEHTTAYPGEKTLANSAGILSWPESHYDLTRSGIALYGITPHDEEIGASHDLRPAMTLQSRLIAIRPHESNQPVGYSETWVSTKATMLGVVAMGYGDGYPRMAPSGTPVWINGRQVPIVGRVSMDMITVDLGADATDKVGDRVEFWGNHLPVEQVAAAIGTIPYELVIKLTKRVVKTYI